MNIYQRLCRFLYKRIRQDARVLPSRKGISLKGSYVHEEVDLTHVVCSGENAISKDCVFLGKVILGKYTTTGRNAIFHGGSINVGNYCQIGPYASFYAIEHPQDYLTIFNSKRLLDGELKQLSVSAPINIGHGVWIGHGACILKGVNIGNGAIIGANAVISKDVDPYSIVVGNPGKVVRKRFTANEIEWIEKSAWWARSASDLEPFKDLLTTKVSEYTAEQIESLLSLKQGND